MQIITIEDKDFNELLQAWKNSRTLGRFWKAGKLQIVSANRFFLMVSDGDRPEQISIRPAHNIQEASDLGYQLLEKEQENGTRVDIEEPEP